MATQNTHDYADHFPRRANMYVENMVFAADVDKNGFVRIELGTPVVADADGVIDGASIASALDKSATGIIAGHRDLMGRYGRNLTIVLSGAGTPAVTIHGLDYLGQPMSETFEGNGTTPVAGNKAFKEVTSITSAAVSATTIDVGYGTKLGLPYAIGALAATDQYMDGVVATAGTFAAAVLTDPQTATTGDPRGTYIPNTAPNGARDYVLIGKVIEGDLHGIRHYAA